MFASVFPLLYPAFILVALLFVLLSSAFLLCLSSGALPLLLLVLSSCLVFVVSFSLAVYAQKERAQRFIPCVLACPVVCVLV